MDFNCLTKTNYPQQITRLTLVESTVHFYLWFVTTIAAIITTINSFLNKGIILSFLLWEKISFVVAIIMILQYQKRVVSVNQLKMLQISLQIAHILSRLRFVRLHHLSPLYALYLQWFVSVIIQFTTFHLCQQQY